MSVVWDRFYGILEGDTSTRFFNKQANNNLQTNKQKQPQQ